MRITNEQAMKIKSLCRKESQTDSCNDCRYNDNSYDYCPSTWYAPSLAADLIDARELIKEMRSKLLVGGIQATEDMTMFRSIPVDVEIIRDLIKRTKEYAE